MWNTNKKGCNMEADVELKQMWNFKNQETNYKMMWNFKNQMLPTRIVVHGSVNKSKV